MKKSQFLRIKAELWEMEMIGYFILATLLRNTIFFWFIIFLAVITWIGANYFVYQARKEEDKEDSA